MKPKTLVKRLSATLLATTMAASSFSQFSIPVFAQDTTSALSKEQFATAEQLKSFNTNDTDGEKNPAKVYFGDDNQQWWIAGSQKNDGLTLFAAIPLVPAAPWQKAVRFNLKMDEEKEYNGQKVYSNHYGASDIKKTVKDWETSYFTGTEQSLMNETTVYTDDTKNKTVYSTTDKLYLAYGDMDNHQITVGTNSQNSLNNGLRIDQSYWGYSIFWLRSPDPDQRDDNEALCVLTDNKYVYDVKVNSPYGLVPAFELNLSNVLFASVASAAKSEGTLATKGAFTLRYKADNLGSALVSYDKSKVTLTNVPNGTYLVVQNSSEAKTKQITSETEVSATDMGLDSFANCKVWLETTNSEERITYATLATDIKRFNIKVEKGEGLTVTNAEQAEVSGEINPIKVEVTDGYYLPNNYKDTIQGLNGLSVKDVTESGFTIFGTPTSDVNIQLPAATKKYIVNITAGDSLVITNGSQSIERGKPITDITVKVVEGYYLPNNYKDAIQGLNGLSVKDVTESGFTISGTPTSDVNIQLPAATSKPVSGSGSGGGSTSTAKLNPVYRAYNPNNGEHLYTLDAKEFKHITSTGWQDEGVAFMAEEEKNGQALYRVYNPNSGLHHYTLDKKEKNTLVSLGWHDEKVAWYTSKKPQSAPVFRVYNPNDGNHHYTMNKQEKDALVLLGWHDEGLAFRTAPIEK